MRSIGRGRNYSSNFRSRAAWISGWRQAGMSFGMI
jgi:hypothetical protein